MDRFPNKMNISQLAERSGYSADKIDLLMQEGLVSSPTEGFMFSNKHQQEIDNIKLLVKSGYLIECDRHSTYTIDRFIVS